MPQSLGIIREFKTHNFLVLVDAIEENELDLSWDEDGETRRNLENGNYIAFVARARVFFRGEEIASDYLAGCIYESLKAFADHRECGKANRKLEAEGNRARCGSYFAGMIREVIKSARAHMLNVQSIHVRKQAA